MRNPTLSIPRTTRPNFLKGQYFYLRLFAASRINNFLKLLSNMHINPFLSALVTYLSRYIPYHNYTNISLDNVRFHIYEHLEIPTGKPVALVNLSFARRLAAKVHSPTPKRHRTLPLGLLNMFFISSSMYCSPICSSSAHFPNSLKNFFGKIRRLCLSSGIWR